MIVALVCLKALIIRPLAVMSAAQNLSASSGTISATMRTRANRAQYAANELPMNATSSPGRILSRLSSSATRYWTKAKEFVLFGPPLTSARAMETVVAKVVIITTITIAAVTHDTAFRDSLELARYSTAHASPVHNNMIKGATNLRSTRTSEYIPR